MIKNKYKVVLFSLMAVVCTPLISIQYNMSLSNKWSNQVILSIYKSNSIYRVLMTLTRVRNLFYTYQRNNIGTQNVNCAWGNWYLNGSWKLAKLLVTMVKSKKYPHGVRSFILLQFATPVAAVVVQVPVQRTRLLTWNSGAVIRRGGVGGRRAPKEMEDLRAFCMHIHYSQHREVAVAVD